MNEHSADLFEQAQDTARLSASAAFVVGQDEAVPLDRVRAALFIGDTLVIADGGAQQSRILFLDPQGNLLGQQGRRGSGPGEYRFLAGLSRYQDGLIAWDAGLSRLSVLDARGNHQSSALVRTPSGTRLVGAVGGNVLLHWSDPGFHGEDPVGPVEVRIDDVFRIVRPSDGEVVAEIHLPGLEKWAKRTVRGVGGARSHGGPAIVFGRDAVAATTRSRAFLATTDSLVVRVYDEKGEVGRLRMPHAPVAALPEWEGLVRDSLRQSIEAKGPSPLPPMDDGRNVGLVLKEFMLELLEDLPARTEFPAFSALKGGEDGHLWIREYPNPEQKSAAWIRVSQSGQAQVRLEIPMSVEVLDLSADRVAVMDHGPLGEQLVKIYAIRARSVALT